MQNGTHHHTYKVLLVDDSRTDYYLLDHYLSSYKGCKFDLEWIDNYEAGLENVLSKNYDFCLVDYHLGRETGVDLAKSAQQQGAKNPIFICSGEDKAKIKGLEDAANIVGFISKIGLSTQTIIDELRSLIGDAACPASGTAAYHLGDEQSPVVAFSREGRIVLVNDAFKAYDFMASPNIIGVKASDLFNAPILDELDNTLARQGMIFTTRVYVARGEHHRLLWRFMPISLQDAPDIHYVAKAVLQKKTRKRKLHKKKLLQRLWSKFYKDPSYVNINDTYYHRDMFL